MTPYPRRIPQPVRLFLGSEEVIFNTFFVHYVKEGSTPTNAVMKANSIVMERRGAVAMLVGDPT